MSEKSETVDLQGIYSTNVYAKFRCAPPYIKKPLGIFGPLENDTNNKNKNN